MKTNLKYFLQRYHLDSGDRAERKRPAKFYIKVDDQVSDSRYQGVIMKPLFENTEVGILLKFILAVVKLKVVLRTKHYFNYFNDWKLTKTLVYFFLKLTVAWRRFLRRKLYSFFISDCNHDTGVSDILFTLQNLLATFCAMSVSKL